MFATDSCGGSAGDPAVCDTAYFGAVLIGYWAAGTAAFIALMSR